MIARVRWWAYVLRKATNTVEARDYIRERWKERRGGDRHRGD